MGRPAPSAGLSTFSRHAGFWARGIAVLIAVLYAAGFVVVATYLGHYGIRDIEPLRARYVAAGITFISLGLWAGAVGFRVFRLLMGLEAHPKRYLRPLAAVAIPGGTIAAAATTYLLLTLPTGPGYGSTWQYVVGLVLFCLGATTAALFAQAGAPPTGWSSWTGFTRIVAMVAVGVGAILGYAGTIYPALPNSFGGGRAELVELVLVDRAQICPPCPAGEVRLIDYDAHRVVVVLANEDGTERAVEIARGDVRAVIHRSRAPFPTSR